MTDEFAPESEVAILATLEVVARKLQDLDRQRAELVDERAVLVVRARRRETAWGKLHDATGLTRQALNLIARGANGGLLP